MHADRRLFLRATGTAFAALAAAGCTRGAGLMGADGGAAAAPAAAGYGDLVADPAGLIDLPRGFSYRVISRLGDAMDDGGTVPDAADGMGCFDLGDGRIALVRNHELTPGKDGGGAHGPAYDTMARSLVPLPGGTTTLVLDARTLAVQRQFRSLSGTIRNCAGGITPWGSWLTCEEDVTRAGARAGRDHGYVFEVPASATGPVDPVPLKAMGRFNHEAACVDPVTGVVYLTEDRQDGLFYRFLPNVKGRLAEGGRLQALAIDGVPDTRNGSGKANGNDGGGAMQRQQAVAVRWVDLDNPEAPDDDLRQRGAALGASLFARGEGIWMGDGELYFTCTSGGAAGLGQVFRLRPVRGIAGGGGADMLDLFFESAGPDEYNYGDNLTIAPNGHLIVCEDQYTDDAINHLRGIAPDGRAYALARSRVKTEWAGACFSPDGRTLFVNLYSPARTVAITGPWRA